MGAHAALSAERFLPSSRTVTVCFQTGAERSEERPDAPATDHRLSAALFRENAAVDAGEADIVAQVGRHPPGPRVARPRLAPGLALRNLGMLELVQRQVFRLAFDGDKATSPQNPRHGQISRDVDRVVPIVELLLDRGGNIDPPICRTGAISMVCSIGSVCIGKIWR